MRYLLAIISIWGSIGLAGALNCADPYGEWVYRNWTYEGGAAPSPCMVTYRKYWGFEGAAIEKLKGTPASPAAEGDIIDNIDRSSAKVLESHGTEMEGGSTFAQQVTLKRRSGEAVVTGQQAKSISIYMICTDSWLHGAP